MALRRPPSSPGRYEYSNTGYLVLGKLVEAVTGHGARSPPGSCGRWSVEKVDLPCGRTVRGGSGAGPGYVSMSVTDGRRQLTLVATVFDVKADAEHRPPLPSRADAPLVAAFC